MQTEGLGGALLVVIILAFVALGSLAVRRLRQRRLDAGAEPDTERAVAGQAEREGAQAAGDAQAVADDAKAAASPPVIDVAEAETARLRLGLARTHASLRERLAALFGRHPQLDPALLEGLEETLLLADVGISLTTRLLNALREQQAAGAALGPAAVRAELARQLQAALEQAAGGSPSRDAAGPPGAADITRPTGAGGRDGSAGQADSPQVILFVGVNGVGKTTTVGKVAHQMQAGGQRVLVAAADTFRAAAAEQLTVWAERAGCDIVRGAAGADPASVVFDAIAAARARGADVVLVDTAGRLHTKVELMDEIKKVRRAAGKARAGAPDETWLVVDATTGQNALQQAREFHAALTLSGVILTKLDGTARGGVVVAIADALRIPVRYVGVGEQADDLRPFAPQPFVAALLGP